MNEECCAGRAVSLMLATAVIPWTASYEFDEAAFGRQVETIAAQLTRHIYIFGTAGEGYAVNEAQFDVIAAAFWRRAQSAQVQPMLGVISLSLPTLIGRIEHGWALGFREFQISLPAWGALSDAEVDVFFAETCGRFRDCAFHHYNLLRTKRLLTSVEYRRLAAAHPNLVGVKCSTADPAVITDLLKVSPRIRFYFTELGYAVARRQTAEVGLLLSLASVHPQRAQEFAWCDDATRDKALPELQQMAATLKEIADGRFHMDGAYDKMLYRLSDPTFPLRLLAPYASASEADFERFRAALPVRWRR